MLIIGQNFWTLRNMVTKLHKYVYLIKTMCFEQDGQLSLSWFMHHLPFYKNRVLDIICAMRIEVTFLRTYPLNDTGFSKIMQNKNQSFM